MILADIGWDRVVMAIKDAMNENDNIMRHIKTFAQLNESDFPKEYAKALDTVYNPKERDKDNGNTNERDYPSIGSIMEIEDELLDQTEVEVSDNDVKIRISNISLNRDLTDEDTLYIIDWMDTHKKEIEDIFKGKTIDWGHTSGE